MAEIDAKFWHGKWKTGEIRFHQKDVHPQLLKHADLLGPGKVMIPLCGKSLDVLWLRSQNRDVAGIEMSPIACEAFFAENKLSCEKSRAGGFTVFRGERIEIWCGDFFESPPEAWKDVAAIYDRAALIALPPDLRRRYAKKVIQQVENKNLNMLLVAIDYVQEKVEGPPFAVAEAEIKNLYGEKVSSIRKLESQPDDSMSAGRSKFDGVAVIEETYLLQFGQNSPEKITRS